MRYMWHFFTGQQLLVGLVAFWNYLISKGVSFSGCLIITILAFPIVSIVANVMGVGYLYDQDLEADAINLDERLKWANREGIYENEPPPDWKARASTRTENFRIEYREKHLTLKREK